MGNILVTAKADPDLDGTACMLAYADLLNQSGQTAEGIPFGSLSIETQFFTSSQDVSISTRLNDGTGDWDKFILVDASSMAGMPKVVKSENVIEVIDHRPGTPEVEFPNAKIQVRSTISKTPRASNKLFSIFCSLRT
jgi:inorganic pyrophosphatase/exopolyphosphatase